MSQNSQTGKNTGQTEPKFTPTPKFKPSFYGIGIHQGRFYNCVDMMTDKTLTLPNPLIRAPELKLGGWTLRMFPERKIISVIHRSDSETIPDIAKNIPLKRGSIYLFEGHRNQNEIFFQPADIEALLRNLGVIKIDHKDSVSDTYASIWSASGDTEDYKIKRFWIMSDHAGDRLINCPNGEDDFSVVVTPFDEALRDYNGGLQCSVSSDATWVVTCSTLETPQCSEQEVHLRIRKGADLDDVLTSIEQYLSVNGYSKLTDCLKALSAREYLY